MPSAAGKKMAGEAAPASLFERFGMPENLRSNLHDMDWDTLASMLHELSMKYDEKKAAHRKLAKHISLTKVMLADRIRHKSKEGRFDAKFLVELVRLLEKCESMAIEHEVDMSEFLSFLYALIEKMKHEKMRIYSHPRFSAERPLEEFGKLKGKSENGSKAK